MSMTLDTRLHVDNLSSFGTYNPITVLAANATTATFGAPLPPWMPEVVPPYTVAITINPSTEAWQIIWITAYTPGSRTATITMGEENTTGAIAINAPWVHAPTALDFSLAPSYNVVDYGIDMTGTNDSTAALNDLIALVNAAGGGNIVLPVGTMKISNVAATLPSQTPIGLIGAGEGATFIQGASSGIALNFCQPTYVDAITFDCNSVTSCMLQLSTSLIGAIKYATLGTVSNGVSVVIGSASNGTPIASAAFLAGTGSIYLATPGDGLPAFPTGAPSAGTVMLDAIEGDLGCTATLTYTGIAGTPTDELTGVTLVSTVGNGLLLTGNQIQWPISAVASPYVTQTATAVTDGVGGSTPTSATVTLTSVTGVDWGMAFSGPGVPLSLGFTVQSVVGNVVTLSPGLCTPTPGVFTFSPTNMLQISGGNYSAALENLGTGSTPVTCIGTVGGVGADTVVGIDVFGAALSGYFQVGTEESPLTIYDGANTWVYMVTAPNSSAPFYPDRNISGKTITVGSAFNYISAHTIGKCTFINQPSASATAGAFNVVDYAAINIHSMLCQGGSRPTGFFGNRYQIELFKFDAMTMGPGNISLQCESLNCLNATSVQGNQIYENIITGGPAFGQAGNASLRVGPNFYGNDNVHVAVITYDIGKPTSTGITVSDLEFTENSDIVTVASGGFPNVSVGNVIGGSPAHVANGSTVVLIEGNNMTISSLASKGGTSLLTFSGPGLSGAYKDSLVNTHSGGSLGRLSVGLLRMVDPYYCAGPLFLQGTTTMIGVLDIQPGSAAYIETANGAGQILKINNGVLGGGMVVNNASGMYLDLSHCRVFPLWSSGINGNGGTGCIILAEGSAPAGSLPLTFMSSSTVFDFNYLTTVTNPIVGLTNLTLDAHVFNGEIANVPAGLPSAISLLSTGTFSTTSRVFGLGGAGGHMTGILAPTTGTSKTYPAQGVDGYYSVTASATGVTSYYTGTVTSAYPTTIPPNNLVLVPVGAGDTLTLDWTGGFPLVQGTGV
jgi:Pectate lyase superfamily protein